jgi:flagellar hook-associated protein 3 FlgL
VSLANSSYAGTYLFSGTSSSQPFTNDTSTTPATVTYSGDTNQQKALTPGGQMLVTSVPGSAIFSASGANVLASLNSLIADFSSGTTSSSSLDDLNQLRSGLTNVSSQRSILDASLNTLQLTTTYASTEQTNLTASQTSLVATDSASVATDLSNNESQQKALLSVMAVLGKTNLFDYLS